MVILYPYQKGYIAERSGHSRGSVIDLTLANRKKELLYMGTNFDFMDEKSHHDNVDISTEGRKNRKKLKDIMERSGFVAYEKEWWHYRLSGEPYQNNYFNFDIK